MLERVRALLAKAESTTFPEEADALTAKAQQLMTRHALRLFYSPRRRMHPQAKSKFIDPDLSPLPVIRRRPRAKSR